MSLSQSKEEVFAVRAVMAESCEHDHRREFAPESLRRPLASLPQKDCCYSLEEKWERAITSPVFHETSELTCFGFVWAVDLA